MIKVEKIFNTAIPVVYGTNNKYAKYMCVSIQSLVEHSSPDKNYDIIILETDVDTQLKEQIKSIANNKDNISIRFVNVIQIYDEYDSEKLYCHIYFSKEMYLRLFIPEVLADYDKAIYLDCDTIVQSDIAKLHEIDCENNYICASRDYNSIVNIAYYPKVNYYFTKMLNFETMDNYINSGVLLMNLPILREVNLPQKTFELLDKHKELLYPDQDIINLICKDNIKIIHNGWNFVFGINAALVHDNKFINMAIDWSKGLADQRIIHYISDQKPWNVPEMSYADIWWNYAKRCPIYQSLLKDYFDANPDKLRD